MHLFANPLLSITSSSLEHLAITKHLFSFLVVLSSVSEMYAQSDRGQIIDMVIEGETRRPLLISRWGNLHNTAKHSAFLP